MRGGVQPCSISEETSKRIATLRFLLIVLVVFIHNCYTNESIQKIIDSGGVPPVFVENAFGRWVKLFITFGIARAAVPLFFMFAAFLQAKKNDSYPVLLKKRSKSLLLPFVIWNALYVFYFGGLKLLVVKVAPQAVSHPENNMFTWSLAEWIEKILGYKQGGSCAQELPSLAYQFWFIRDLIILIIFSPVIKMFIRKVPYLTFFLLFSLYLIQTRIYIVETQAFFFYVLGFYWTYYDFQLFNAVDKISWTQTIVIFLFFFIYTYTIGRGDHTTEHYVMVLIACIVLLKFSLLLVRIDKVYKICAYLSDFSFFLFAIHAPILNSVVNKIWVRFIPMKNTFFCLLQYFIPTFLTITIGAGIGIALKKICPPLFRLLNGGR